jgi:thiol-disulfide isomerase/thioredoxin
VLKFQRFGLFLAGAAIACYPIAKSLAQQKVTIVDYVRATLSVGDFSAAQSGLAKYKAAGGVTPEYLEALSWVGRSQIGKNDAAGAEKTATDVRKMALEQLKQRKLDAEPHLPLALGAAIEVQAKALVAESQRDQAVGFLKAELKQWTGTSIHDRIQKNLNLLTLEGKPVPELDVAQSIPGHVAKPMSAHRGHPVLIFMWAHWCVDCKNEIPIVQKLEAKYGARGLVVVAPTQHYGYVQGGQDAPRDVETKYIGQIFGQYYAGLGPVEVPLSERNFARFGVSTTPTIVLVDGKGIVRLYNPGNATYEELAAKIEAALKG